MARVYLAISQKQLGFTKLVVLKVLREELDVDGELLAMFVQEAQLAARLNHANVVHTYEAGVDDGRHYIAMEYLEGQALSSVIARAGDRFPLEAHLRVLCDALDGLQYAHDLTDYDGTPLGIVHRDVSPQNVFVTYTGQSKVIDFGIAKTFDSTRTSNGILKGKTGYMAPEQALSGTRPDRRTDVFAIGVMMWEALAGRRFVPRGEDEMVALARRISGRDPRIRDVAPDAPAALADICDKAMATDPADRFASATEMREAIEACLATRPAFDARQIAQVLDETFAEERARIRRLVDEQVKEAFHSRPIIDLHTEAAVTPARGAGGGSVGGMSIGVGTAAGDSLDDAPPTRIVTETRPSSVMAAPPATALRVPAPGRARVLVWTLPLALVALVALVLGLVLARADRASGTRTAAAPSAAPSVDAGASPRAPEPAAPSTSSSSPSPSSEAAALPGDAAAPAPASPHASSRPGVARGTSTTTTPRKTSVERAHGEPPAAAPSPPKHAPAEAAGLRPLDGNPWEKTE